MVVLLFLLIFADMVIFAGTLSRKGKKAKAQIAQTLGVTPVSLSRRIDRALEIYRLFQR